MRVAVGVAVEFRDVQGGSEDEVRGGVGGDEWG